MKSLALFLLAPLVLTGCGSEATPGGDGDGWLSDSSPGGTEVRLRIGPETFSGEVEAELDASGAKALDPDSFEADTGTRPITHPAVTRFSSVQIAEQNQQIDLWIEVPPEAIQEAEQAGRTIHGMIRLVDEHLPGPYPEAMREWHRALGPLIRSESGQVFLRLKLYVAAGELYAVAVSSPRYRLVTDADLSRTARKRQPDGVFDVPWVIVCHGAFEDPSVCDPDPESPGEGRLALWESQQAAAWLKQQGFERARYLAVPHAEALRYAEDEASGSLISESAADPDDPVVHIARLTPQYPCGKKHDVVGCYLPSTGEIAYALRAVGSSGGDGTGMSNVFVHEMTHGIQAAMIEWVFYEEDPGEVRWHWIFEGTAEAVAFWSLVPEPESLLQIRSSGHWHPWDLEHPLNHNKDKFPYLAVEFFLAADSGDPTYLPLFFERIEELGFHETSYDAVDQAIEAELGSRPLDFLLALTAPAASLRLQENLQAELPLGLSFLRMMTERTPTQGFPHCQEKYSVAGQADDPVVELEIPAVTVPFSSACFQVEVLYYQDNFPGSCLKLSLKTGDSPDELRRMVFLLDGGTILNQSGKPQTIAYAGDALWIHGDSGTIQLIDLDLERGEEKPPGDRQESTIVAEVDRNCGVLEEEMANCQPTKVVCGETSCSLQMSPSPADECWVSVGQCVREEGCSYLYGGEWVSTDFGVCSATRSLMQNWQPAGTVQTFEDAKLPAHGRCGLANFCRRIILCPKESP